VRIGVPADIGRFAMPVAVDALAGQVQPRGWPLPWHDVCERVRGPAAPCCARPMSACVLPMLRSKGPISPLALAALFQSFTVTVPMIASKSLRIGAATRLRD
jgi:hypothetical protein